MPIHYLNDKLLLIQIIQTMRCVKKINHLLTRTKHRIIGNKRLFYEEPLVKPFDKPFEKPFDDPLSINPTDGQEKTRIKLKDPWFNPPDFSPWDQPRSRPRSRPQSRPQSQPIDDYSDFSDFPDITFIVEITKQ
jgi:hypothetical protein